MTVDFYTMDISPQCRVVEMAAAAVGVKLNKHTVNLVAGEQLKDEYIKINPRHKIPFIVDGELKLGETRAIVSYFMNKYGGDDNPLYPKCPTKRAMIDEILFYDGTGIYQTAGETFYPRLRGIKVLDVKGLEDVLVLLDERIGSNGCKFIAGDHLTIADICLAGTLTILEANEFDTSKYSHIVKYQDTLKSSIPSYHEINDKPVEDMRAFIKSRLEA